MLRILLTAAFAATATMAPAATTPPYTDVVVFGDSLSDPGNIAPGLTFTNGQTFAGQLGALRFASGGTNFAFGGAKAATDTDPFPDFAAQREIFASVRPALGADPLTVVFFGGNDLLSPTGPSAIGNSITAISTGIMDLSARFGLTRFLLPGLPDLGRIPRNVGTFGADFATGASKAFNTLLQTEIASFAATPLDVSYFDTFSFLNAILDAPTAFGFDPETASQSCQAGRISCAGFIFWDDIHPTAAVHSLVADAVRDAASPSPVPLPAGGLLLLGALGGLAVARRRSSSS